MPLFFGYRAVCVATGIIITSEATDLTFTSAAVMTFVALDRQGLCALPVFHDCGVRG